MMAVRRLVPPLNIIYKGARAAAAPHEKRIIARHVGPPEPLRREAGAACQWTLVGRGKWRKKSSILSRTTFDIGIVAAVGGA